MSAVETPKKILTFEACFLCKAKVSSEEKIKVFGKSAVAIHSLILRATKIDLSVYVESDLPLFAAPDVIIVCFGIRELWTKSQKLKMKSNKISHMTARSGSKDSLKSQDKSQRRKRA